MVAKAKVRIEGEDATAAAWRSALGRAKTSADGFSKIWKASLVGIGFSTVANAIIGVAKEAIELGDNLNKAAIKAGVSGKTISELAYAAKMADIDLESLSTALKKMQISLSEAKTGGKEQTSTLKALGISIQDILNLKPDQQFELLAQKISELRDPADRTRAAVQLFGKAGADLLPLFAQGAEGIRKARAEIISLGGSFDDNTLTRMADVDDAIKRLDASWQAYWVTLVSKVAPALTRILDAGSSGKMANIGEAYLKRGMLGGLLEAAGVSGGETDNPGAGPKTGVIDRSGPVIGFAAQRAAEIQARTTEIYNQAVAGAAAEAESEYERLNDQFLSNYEAMTGDQIALSQELTDEDIANQVEAFQVGEELNERRKAGEEELALWREQRAMESAQVMQDFFLSAYDNFVRNGKFRWNELLQYMLAQLARSQLAKALEGIFDGSDTGWFGQLLGAFSGSSGPGGVTPRASGGPVSAGQMYLVGEKRAELFRPRTSGTIIPNVGLGGGNNFAFHYSIDARGADASIIPRVANMIKASEGRTKADFADGLRSGRYPING